MKSHPKKKLEKRQSLREDGENYKEKLLEVTKAYFITQFFLKI